MANTSNKPKYSNIIGTGFPEYVKNELGNRQKIIEKRTRDSKDLVWLTNRTGWFRLSSGAKINPNPSGIDGLTVLIDNEFDITIPRVTTGTVQNTLDPSVFPQGIEQEDKVRYGYKVDAGFTDELAKKYVLQGGTISTTTGQETNRKTQFSQTYTKNQETQLRGQIDDLGYKPMPGITNVSVGTRGKWRTTIESDIEFICYNLEQLEIMNKLYMSLGVHVLLEWGHSPYLDSKGNVKDFFNPIDFFGSRFNNRDSLVKEIENKKLEHNGNYGATLGRVYNFTYQSNPDGSYNCKIQIVGEGAILESIWVNRSSRLDFDGNTRENNADKFESDLTNALSSIKNVLRDLDLAYEDKQENPIGIITGDEAIRYNKFRGVNSTNFFRKPTDVGLLNAITSNFRDPTIIEAATNRGNLSYGDILNSIFQTSTYKGYQFSPEGIGLKNISSNNDFQKFGNAHQIISGLDRGEKDNLNPISPEFFYGYATRYTQAGKAVVSANLEDIDSYYYITFGHLLALIQHLCVFNTNNSSPQIDISSSSKNSIKPVVYIDYHPDNTIMKTGVIEASINPSICIVPFRVNAQKGKKTKDTFDLFFNPLDTRKEKNYSWLSWLTGEISNEDKNIVLYPERNQINEGFKDTFQQDPLNNKNFPSSNKLMHVLVEVNHAIKVLKNLAGESNNTEVDLLTYINALLDDITISLGKINNFRAFYDDNSHTVRIIDQHRTEEIRDLITIPNFGLKSLAYDYSLSSYIDSKTAAKIVIASQGTENGIKDFSDDVMTYQKLNNSVRDRFSPSIIPAVPIPKDKSESSKRVKVLQKLYDHIYKVYTLRTVLSENEIINIQNIYSDHINQKQKYDPQRNATLLLPIELQVKIDGITGILPFNAFKLPDNRLPLRYQGKVYFIVFSIDHEFESNNWYTVLKGHLQYLEGTEVIEDRKISQNINKPKKRPPVDTVNEITPISYQGKLDLPLPTADFTIPTTPKAEKLPEDSTPVQPEDNLTPTGDSRPQITSLTIDPTPGNIPTDIQLALEFIKPLETPGGVPQLIAYKDLDYTVSAGFKWRIGFGSDTVTSTLGTPRPVKEGDTTTIDAANADIERRVKTQFKPKVVSTCSANGVDYDSLPSPVKTVFIDCAYNYGSLWNDIVISYRDGGVQGLIQELQNRINRGANQVPTRRAAEIRHLGGTPRL